MDLCELENAPETQKWPKTFVQVVDMTTKLSEFPKHYLGAFCFQRDVHVNIDVTKATEY